MKLKKFWIKREQQRFRDTENMKSLELQKNEEIYIYKGRIEDAYPTYISKESPLAEKLFSLSIRELCMGELLL